ncbi:uncharacterized protein LOC129909645, partial [Episyrphus balteatus]|uniref:uncharacterized protein LOC129909645 n=1 Tax=Episyrphus balteatus TaxID=286459 RepID=UPI002485D349
KKKLKNHHSSFSHAACSSWCACDVTILGKFSNFVCKKKEKVFFFKENCYPIGCATKRKKNLLNYNKMQHILPLAISLIPLLSITFVTFLILYKLYVKIRSNFKVTVNCWFCNQNTKVPYLDANSFTCPQCDQYNGFTKDGDYNREIYQQLDCSNLSSSNSAKRDDRQNDFSDFSDQFPANGFCHVCNEGQRLKIEKLAQFETKNESKFEKELKVYKNQLEEQYRLCTTCDRHLKRVLREKKKMVLGSKFLDFIIKGAEKFKQPHFARIKNAQKTKMKRKISIYIAVLALVNTICILRGLPDLTKEHLTFIFGDRIGHFSFLMISHVLALMKVFASYSEILTNHPMVLKVGLFLRTITMMVLYSMGMKLPQVATLNMTSFLMLASPFLMLTFAFLHNFVDGFKLSRFTFMLTLWSLFAGGILDNDMLKASKDIILLTASLITIYLSLTSKSESKLFPNDDTSSSFHKIYSEDCFSDEDTRETISLISQKLNSSGNSVMSASSGRSFVSHSQISTARLVRSPITSSVMSLNGAPRSPTFQSFSKDPDQSLSSPFVRNRNYAASMSNFSTNRSLFASNVELDCIRPQSTFGANASFTAPLVMNATLNASTTNKLNDDSFQKAPLSFVNTPLASPFSVSTSAVYQQRSNLLTPSRFSTNSLATNNPSASWLSGGYFNSGQVNAAHQAQMEKNTYFQDHRNALNSIQENISRASSHSSGFESQSSANQRENSMCPDQEQYPQISTSISEGHQNGFHPIDQNGGLFHRPTPLMNGSFQPPVTINSANSVSGFSLANSLNTTIQPLSVNCNQDYWKPMKAQPTGQSRSNAFNLRKINEELPPIQRGALLKKWKEGQTLS